MKTEGRAFLVERQQVPNSWSRSDLGVIEEEPGGQFLEWTERRRGRREGGARALEPCARSWILFCEGKLLEDFRQGSAIIQFMC